MSRLSTRPHMCPWPQCLELVPHTQLFCKAHWFRIPQPERVELNAAFKARARDARRHLNAIHACVNAARALSQVDPSTIKLHADQGGGR